MDGRRGWLARTGLLVIGFVVVDSFRVRAQYRTQASLPKGEHDVWFTGGTGRRGRARRTLRRVFGLGVRQSAALVRSVSRRPADPVRLVRGTQPEAAEALAARLRARGLTVKVVPTSAGENMASFRA